jgi:23S rRNA (guanine1835-N2)-methyltransferase
MSSITFPSFSGTYTLERRPKPAPHQPLQAWDAADAYLLSAAAPLLQEQPEARVLIVNDAFGALAVALHTFKPHSWSDSFIAELALAENLQRNALPNTVRFVPATIPPPATQYDVVLWRVPKSRALFEQQRSALQPLLHADTLVLAGGMVKHLTDRAKEVLSALGSVSVYPVQKKAVLLHVTPQPDLPRLSKLPDTVLPLPEYDMELTGGPNVFAHERIDIGARVFLEQFARLPKAKRIADLGCGNGILGLVAKRLQPDAEVYFFDESYQAVASAEENYRRNGRDTVEPMAHFHVDDGLTHYTGEPFDLILCNPPFHQAHVIDDQIARQMFTQSKQHLRSGGELWIVGNRHLDYHLTLRRLFGNCRQIAAHPKFVVLAAVKQSSE